MKSPLIIDSTKTRSWMQCKRKYYYSYLSHLESAKATALDLVFGSVVHECLEYFENKMLWGMEKEEALLAALWKMQELTDPWTADQVFINESKKNRTTAIRLLIWYAEQFHENGLDCPIKPVANEIPFRESLRALVLASPFADQIDLTGIDDDMLVCGRLDSIVEGPSRGEFWIRERKTTNQALTQYYWARYEPDIQISLYSWVAKILFPDLNLQGVLLEAFQVGTGFVRMQRREFKRWPEQAIDTVRAIVSAAREMDKAGIREEVLPPVDTFLMNEGCCMAGGMPCNFRAICNEAPRLRKYFIADNFRPKKPWNPLDDMDQSMIASLSNQPKLHFYS